METMKVERLKKLVGESDTAKAVEIRDWLKNHEKKVPIVQSIDSE